MLKIHTARMVELIPEVRIVSIFSKSEIELFKYLEAHPWAMERKLIPENGLNVINIKKENKNMENTKTTKTNPLEATVPLMLSGDYKERFIAEYRQTKIRYERLKAFNNEIEAAIGCKEVEEPKHDCPYDLLRRQQSAMGEYLHILEVRAVIEGIELLDA